MAEPTIRHITARDGTRLMLRDWAPNPNAPRRVAVFCLSGLTRNSKDFIRVAQDMADRGSRVVALDYRGRGGSDRSADPMKYNPSVYLDDITQVLAALNLHRVVVMGTSLGGFMAMGMAVAMPSAIAGAIINDAGPDVPELQATAFTDYVGDTKSFASWEEAEAACRAMLPDMNLEEHEWRILTDGSYREENGRIVPNWDSRIAIPLRKSGAIPDLWPIFGALKPYPTLVTRGALSKLLTQDCFDRMAAVHPNMRRITIDNRGHAPTLDEPQSREAIHALLAAVA